MLSSFKFNEMENIIEAIKNINHELRLTNHNKWLVWDDSTDEYVVYELKKTARLATELSRTIHQEEAVKDLLD
jgi:Mg2+/Co2+ transporter CorB